MMIGETFGAKMKRARGLRGISQAKLWKRIKEAFRDEAISLSTIKRVENDQTNFENKTRIQIVHVLSDLRGA
jgi:transcriptional regulator with XRE-family HTH domain